jgi:hypothetical protein
MGHGGGFHSLRQFAIHVMVTAANPKTAIKRACELRYFAILPLVDHNPRSAFSAAAD